MKHAIRSAHRGKRVENERAPARARAGFEPEELNALNDLPVNRLRLLDRLAEDLAHEVKNPLNAIVINLELLKRRLLDGDSENALYRAECVSEEVRRVSALTDALFHALRSESDPGTPADVDGTVRELLPVFAPRAKLSGARLREDLAAGPVRGHMSEPVLKQILLNMVMGALDAVGPGQAEVLIGTARGSDDIRVRVSCRGLRRPLDNEGERWSVVRALATRWGARFRIERHGPGGMNADLVLIMDRISEREVKTQEPSLDHPVDLLFKNKRSVAETGTSR